MTDRYDVAAIGNAIVDVIAPASDAFLVAQGLSKGAMTLVDQDRSDALLASMAQGVETSGGSAANTIAGLVSLGGRGAFIGKVAADRLGDVFRAQLGADFHSSGALTGGPATGCCMINVTPDAQRTMATFLGAAGLVSPDDIDPAVIEAARITYLEGYLFDPEDARRAFAKAAGLARASGRLIALSLSDGFVVERHRAALLGFIDSEVDVLFANEDEAHALFQAEDFAGVIEGAKKWGGIAALTRSAKGCVIVEDGMVHEIPAAPVSRVLDTTGAGDQFAAGFLYGLTHGKGLPDCGRLGALAAAEVISHYGARPETSLKDLAEKAGLL